MSIPARCAGCCILCGMLLLTGSGCSLFPSNAAPGSGHITSDRSAVDDEQTHRQRFQNSRDPDAMRWLLAHSLQQGMTVAEVGRVFGEDGQREYNDRWIKTGGGFYRRDDVVYRWGPDSDGQSAYLVFRDGKLTNFDPADYQ